MKNIRVILFEDNTMLRESLFELIDSNEGFTCAGSFANCDNVLANIRDTNPDVILMDIEMPGLNGIEAVKIIKAKYPEAKILMETIFEDDDKVFASICNGAEGYILKSNTSEEILNAIQEIYEGGSPMTPAIARKVLKMFKSGLGVKDESFNLTAREKEILSCLVEGMSYKLIADRCLIRIDTVRGHIKSIYEKLQVHSMSEAVAKAIKGKIV